jgi:hypothetical protein
VTIKVCRSRAGQDADLKQAAGNEGGWFRVTESDGSVKTLRHHIAYAIPDG